MNTLFIADLHIKLNQKNVPVEWARNRYSMFIEQTVGMCSKADLLVLGGDIWDKYPSAEELEIYFELVKRIPIATVIYAGNHEAAKKNTTFFTSFKDVTTWVNPLVTVIDDFCTIQGIDFIPYNKLKEPWPDSLQSRVVCSHFRAEIPPHVKPEIDLDLFNRWELVLAGDLHSYENSQRNILYPGSPMTTSFHRSKVKTGAILLDTETLQHDWLEFKLPQLLRKTIEAGEGMPATEYDHTIYELTGDMTQLGGVADSDLIDKKIVKRSSDTALILGADMTLEQEVSEYLEYILELPEDAITNALQELSNHASQLTR